MSLYPNAAANSCAAGVAPANAYFSPIPRAVWDLRRAHRLTPRDVDVLGLLLDYKAHSTPIVAPPQAELARRLDCSTDTIARSVLRLRRAGLVAVERRTDRRGRHGNNRYDLSAVLALMPVQAAKLRGGQWGRSAAVPSPDPEKNRGPEPPGPTPQNCGVSDSGDSDVVRDNRPAPGPIEAPGPPAAGPPAAGAAVVAALQDAGILAPRARALARTCGEDRCRAALAAAARVPHFRRSRAAWIVGALTQSWPLIPDAPTRPQAQWPYRPPTASPAPAPPPDALAALSPDAYAALQAKARAQLWEETRPACRETLLGGRHPAYVRTRMRLLLATGAA